VIGPATSIILLMLFLHWKNESSYYFFMKKWSSSLSSIEKNEAPHYFFRTKTLIFFLMKNEALLHVFLKKAWGTWACCLNILADVISAVTKSSASVFLQKKIKCLIISSEKMLVFFFEENMIHLIFVLQK
jgi:hypothetical protein